MFKQIIFYLSRPIFLFVALAIWTASFPGYIQSVNEVRSAAHQTLSSAINSPYISFSSHDCSTFESDNAINRCLESKKANKKLIDSDERKSLVKRIKDENLSFNSSFKLLSLSELNKNTDALYSIILFDYTQLKEEGSKNLKSFEDMKSYSKAGNEDLYKVILMYAFPFPVLFWLFTFIVNIFINGEKNARWREMNRKIRAEKNEFFGFK